MRNLICRQLADLASVRIQHRFIRDATVDFYLLPKEALERAYYAVELARTSTTLGEEHRRAVEEFAVILDSAHPDISIADFFDTDADWLRLRSAAATCLENLGFDLNKYENDEMMRYGSLSP